VTELVRELTQLELPDLDFFPASSLELGAGALTKLFQSLFPVGRTTLEQQLLLPRRIKHLPVELFHFFAHGDAPVRCPLPYLVTVLDLIPLRFPELYQADRPNWRFRFARYLELESIKRASGILTISECTKRDLKEILGIADERIFVTPLAVSKSFLATAPANEEQKIRLREEFSLPTMGPNLLYVGGIDPRKNVPFLIQAFAELRRQLGGRYPALRLLLAGRYESDRHFPRLREEIAKLDLEAHVSLLGFIPDEQLPRYYQAADLVVFPSLYEGFGLPVLEAMASGVPVLAGSNSSIPEVVGTEYPLAEDANLCSWVTLMGELIQQPALRTRCQELGLQRANLFTWRMTAERTVAAYRYFLQQSRI